MTMELHKNKLNTKLGKVYYPLSPLDDKGEKFYVLQGYQDAFLKPYILNTLTYELEKVQCEQTLEEHLARGVFKKVIK